MSRSKHRNSAGGHRKLGPVQEALQYVESDLVDLRRQWPLAVQQLHLDVDAPPARNTGETTAEAMAARDELARQERAERVINARRGRVTLGYSPAPLRMAALDDLVMVETQLLELADRITAHVRRNSADPRPGTHRLLRKSARPRPPGRRELDHLGYPLRLGYGKQAVAGRDLALVGSRVDPDPTMAAVAWITRALPSITDLKLAEDTAALVSSARYMVRAVAGLPDMQVRLSPACFVCGEHSLRMNLDRRYVECRNPSCEPAEDQCSFAGPRGEPRWSEGEWPWLSQRIGVSLSDHVRDLLREVAS